MFELEHTEQIKRLIEITKSNSGISGPELAKAHIELGRLLSAYLPVEPMDTTVRSWIASTWTPFRKYKSFYKKTAMNNSC